MGLLNANLIANPVGVRIRESETLVCGGAQR